MFKINNSLTKIIADARYVPYTGATSDVNLGTKNFLTEGTLGANGILLASGSIINWDSGDITLTHSANTLTFAGMVDFNLGSNGNGINFNFFSDTEGKAVFWDKVNGSLVFEGGAKIDSAELQTCTGNISQWTNDVGYYQSGSSASFNTLTATGTTTFSGSTHTLGDGTVSAGLTLLQGNIFAYGFSNVVDGRVVFGIYRARGTYAEKLAVQNNDALGFIFFGGWDGVSAYHSGGGVYGYVDGTVSSGVVPMRISFLTGTNSTTRKERLKILSNGDITFGSGVAGYDQVLTFDGQTYDGILTWMEDEDYFKFSDDILMNSTEAIYFRDTAIKLASLTDGHLDWTADISFDFNIGATEQVSLIDGVLQPTTTNDIDLGTSDLIFKNAYINNYFVGSVAGIDATIPIAPVLPLTVAGSATFIKGILTAYTPPS